MNSVLQALGFDGTFFAEIVNFLLLLLLLSWRAFPATRRTLADRRQKVEGALAQAEDEREEAVRLKEQHLAELRQARAEAQGILERAERTAAEQVRQVLEEAREQGERLKRQAEADIGRERDGAILALRREVGDLVVAATEKLVRRHVDESVDRQWIDEFLADVASQ